MHSDRPRVPDAPSLGDRALCREALLIGFSYTLWADGSPGLCNRQIAREIKESLRLCLPDVKPCLAVQWEIFDALEEMNDDIFKVSEFSPIVAEPPRFEPAEIKDATAFVDALNKGSPPAVRILRQELEAAPGWMLTQKAPDSDNMANMLNFILDDRRFYEPFERPLDLYDLDRSAQRPELGLLGLEKRKIPKARDYPNGLRRFQAQRINRLIVEAIVPDRILTRGIYLNVKQVVQHVLRQTADRPVGHVFIFGHPRHRDWCRKMTIQTLSAQRPQVVEDRVHFGGTGVWNAQDLWDADSAQVWCRSEENWEAYTRV